MLEKLDFLVRFWALKARHDLAGEPLTTPEQIELLSLLQLVTRELALPAAGPLAKVPGGVPAELIGEGDITSVEIRGVSAAALLVSSPVCATPGGSVVVRVVDAVSGVEYTLPCRVEWSHGAGPASLALRVDGVPVRGVFTVLPDPRARVRLGRGARERSIG